MSIPLRSMPTGDDIDEPTLRIGSSGRRMVIRVRADAERGPSRECSRLWLRRAGSPSPARLIRRPVMCGGIEYDKIRI